MSENGLKRYRLIFYGTMLPEAEPEQARQALARMFRLDASMVERCFSGRKVALRSSLDEREAYKLQSQLEDMGLMTHLEMTGDQAPAPAPRAAPAAADLELAAMSRPSATSSPAAALPGELIDALQPPMPPPARRIRWGWLAVPLLITALIPVGLRLAEPLRERYASERQVEHALQRGQEVTRHLHEFITRTNFWPNSNLDASLPAPDAYADQAVARIRVLDKALVVVTFREELEHIGGQNLLFVPRTDSSGEISWQCQAETLPQELIPAACGGEVQAPVYEQKFAATVGAPKIMPTQPAAGPATTADLRDAARQLLEEAFDNTASLRRQMVEYLVQEGSWPLDNQALGAPPGRRLGSDAFRRIEIEPEGRLLFDFSENSGLEGHKVWLVPSRPGFWGCESTLSSDFLPRPCLATTR